MAGLEKRIKGIADHLGANVDDYHLGLDKLARKGEVAKAMILLQQCASKGEAHLTRKMREAARDDGERPTFSSLVRRSDAPRIVHASSVIFRSESQNLQRAQEARNVMTVDAVHSLEDHS